MESTEDVKTTQANETEANGQANNKPKKESTEEVKTTQATAETDEANGQADNGGVWEKCKVIIAGNGAVGKSCLVFTYLHDEFQEEIAETIFDHYDKDLNISGKVSN